MQWEEGLKRIIQSHTTSSIPLLITILGRLRTDEYESRLANCSLQIQFGVDWFYRILIVPIMLRKNSYTLIYSKQFFGHVTFQLCTLGGAEVEIQWQAELPRAISEYLPDGGANIASEEVAPSKIRAH